MNSISKLTFFDKPILYQEEITSTSDFLKEELARKTIEAPVSIFTDYQTHGRGQYGKEWQAERGDNLLFSFAIPAYCYTLENLFLFSLQLSSAIVDALNDDIGEPLCEIKWPNDIILNNKKIAGILVEPIIKGDSIQHIVAGLGINLFQKKFPPHLPNASSLSMCINQKNINRELLLKNIIHHIENFVQLVVKSEIILNFSTKMHRLNEKILIKKNGVLITCFNQGISENGAWILKNSSSGEILIIQSSSEIEYIYT